jgi:hypothetical protein
MKKIIITESQLNVLFEQGVSDEDKACIDQLTDNDGTQYSITVKTKSDKQTQDCKTKEKLSAANNLLLDNGITEDKIFISSHNNLCYLLVSSKTKSKISGWTNTPRFFITFWDFGKIVVTYIPYYAVKGGGKDFIKFVYEGSYDEDGTYSELTFDHMIDTNQKKQKVGEAEKKIKIPTTSDKNNLLLATDLFARNGNITDKFINFLKK